MRTCVGMICMQNDDDEGEQSKVRCIGPCCHTYLYIDDLLLSQPELVLRLPKLLLKGGDLVAYLCDRQADARGG